MSIGFGILLLLLFGVHNICLRRDFRHLERLFPSILFCFNSFEQPKFTTNAASALWKRITRLLFIHRSRINKEVNLDELIALGRNIISQTELCSIAANTLCTFLEKEGQGEIFSTAIFFKQSKGELVTAAWAGYGRSRLETSILLSVEERLDGSQPWGQIFDLQPLDVHSSYYAPIGEGGSTFGALWIGFRKPTVSANWKLRRILEVVCEHCAAALSAREKFHSLLREKHRERDWLLGASHDLRAPGHIILLSLEELLGEEVGNLTEGQKIRLRLIRECMHEQQNILSDVFDFAKLSQHMLCPQPTRVDVFQMCTEILSLFSLHARKKGLSVRLVGNAYSWADPSHVRRIVTNLLSNAIKYTEQGEVLLQLCSRDSAITLEIQDSGIGIPPRALGELFRPFQTFTHTSLPTALGLGLSVVKHLAELNDGSLSYRPNPNGGSIFIVSLPRTAKTSDATEECALPCSFPTVLIVENDLRAQRALMRMLAKNISTVSCASNISVAEQTFMKTQPEIILLDWHIGVQTAEGFLQFLEEMGFSGRVVLTTGSADLLPLPCSNFRFSLTVVKKPFYPEALYEAMFAPFSTPQTRQNMHREKTTALSPE